MPDIAFVNGRFLPWKDATVSIDDRGFQFGDGVYEVIRTYRGVAFELAAHLARLERSVKELNLPVQPYSRSQWMQWIQQGLSQAGYQESKVYIQITRGIAPRDHAFPLGISPTVVMTIRELRPLSVQVRQDGVTARTCDDLRWGRCDIKSLNYAGESTNSFRVARIHLLWHSAAWTAHRLADLGNLRSLEATEVSPYLVLMCLL